MPDSRASAVATRLLAAFDQGAQLTPPSRDWPEMTLAEGYAVAADIHARRISRGDRVAGRKIGFTNRKIWDIYNVHAPVWGWMYQNSTRHIPNDRRVTLPALPECRIEPEIAFHFIETPNAAMTDTRLAACIDRIAHGFEVVWSAYPGWQFTAPDSVAAFAMHASFAYGPPQAAAPFLAHGGHPLANLKITLTGPSGTLKGSGEDVLGGPLQALRRLIAETEAMPGAAPIGAGEWITTGTLTDARPVFAGDRWQTHLEGVDLPDLDVTFAATP